MEYIFNPWLIHTIFFGVGSAKWKATNVSWAAKAKEVYMGIWPT